MRLFIAVVFALVSFSACARPATPQERASLNTFVSQYLVDLANKKSSGLVRAMPPRVMQALAKRSGVGVSAMKASMTKQIEQTMVSSSFSDTAFDLKGIDLTDTVLPDKSPVVYGWVPVSFSVRVKGRDVDVSNSYLAVLDGGKWYLLRINGRRQAAIVKTVYPFVK